MDRKDFFIFCVCVWDSQVPQQANGAHRTVEGAGPPFPSTMWVLRIELKLLGLAIGTFILLAVSLALKGYI